MALVLAFLIGLFTGLRSFTPAAVVAWAAHVGWINLAPPLAWMGSAPAAVIFTLLALAELVADKLPSTPNRTAPAGLIARCVLGALTGACMGMAAGVLAIGAAADMGVGAALGVAGALAGAFGGFQARTRLVKALGTRDLVVALLEDVITIGGSLFTVTRF